MFNEFQEDHLKELENTPSDLLCWCGWYMRNECPQCSEHDAIKHLTHKDCLDYSCLICGGQPDISAPKDRKFINHIITCKQMRT